MGNVIVINVGRAGARVGLGFLAAMAREHGLNMSGEFQGQDNPTPLTDVFFRIHHDGRFMARTVLVDLDKELAGYVASAACKPMIDPLNVVHGKMAPLKLFPQGALTEGADLLEPVMARIAAEVELCEQVDGFMLIHGLSGGIGSGLGSLIMSQLRDTYPQAKRLAVSLFPSPSHQGGELDAPYFSPYNVILGAASLLDSADLMVAVDNDALVELERRKAPRVEPAAAALNTYIIDALCNLTAPLRFAPDPARDDQPQLSLSGLIEALTDGSQLELPSLPTDCKVVVLASGKTPLTRNGEVDLGRLRDVPILATSLRQDEPRLTGSVMVRGTLGDDGRWAFDKACKYGVMGLHQGQLLITPAAGQNTVLVCLNCASTESPLGVMLNGARILFSRQAALPMYAREGLTEQEMAAAIDRVAAVVALYDGLVAQLRARYQDE